MLSGFETNGSLVRYKDTQTGEWNIGVVEGFHGDQVFVYNNEERSYTLSIPQNSIDTIPLTEETLLKCVNFRHEPPKKIADGIYSLNNGKWILKFEKRELFWTGIDIYLCNNENIKPGTKVGPVENCLYITSIDEFAEFQFYALSLEFESCYFLDGDKKFSL